jgi:tetratricopeptide (TPR) repeat protein
MGEGISLTNIGGVYWNLGQYSQALNYYQQALAVSREIGDRSGEGYILSSMGGVYSNQGDYTQALTLYQQALAIRREIGDKAGEGNTLNSMAGVYYSLGQYPQALEFYQQAVMGNGKSFYVVYPSLISPVRENGGFTPHDS